jgi:hypothetical protein
MLTLVGSSELLSATCCMVWMTQRAPSDYPFASSHTNYSLCLEEVYCNYEKCENGTSPFGIFFKYATLEKNLQLQYFLVELASDWASFTAQGDLAHVDSDVRPLVILSIPSMGLS